MALSFLLSKPPLSPPNPHPSGALSYFSSSLLHYDLSLPSAPNSSTTTSSADSDSYTIRQIFKADGKGREGVAVPPLHWHLWETERFEVNAGTAIMLINGVQRVLKKGDTLTSPPRQVHTFWCDPNEDEDLDVTVTVTGKGKSSNPGFDDHFIHNFYGYLDSMNRKGLSPNPLQIFRFLDAADVVLASPPFGLGRVSNVVLGRWIGGYLFGLPTRYEILEPKKSS